MKWLWMFWNEYPSLRIENVDAHLCDHLLCYIVFGERFFFNGIRAHRTLLHCWNCGSVATLPKTWEHIGYTV